MDARPASVDLADAAFKNLLLRPGRGVAVGLPQFGCERVAAAEHMERNA